MCLAGCAREVVSPELFAPLLADLKGALEISEIGPANVDGQPTVEFLALLPSPNVLAGVHSRRKQLREHEPDLRLEVSFASNGLPVRTITTDPTPDSFTIQQDILALEVPVAVHAPPARETIDQARLAELERRRAKRRRR